MDDDRRTPPGPGGLRHARWWAALSGVVSAAAGFAVAELVAAFVSPRSSPIFAVGAGVVDQVPPWLKDFAVENFGTNDKAVLLGGMIVTLALGAALSGALELRRPPVGAVLLGAVGLVITIVALARPDAKFLWAAPTVIGVTVAIILLRTGAARLRAWEVAETSGTPAGTGVPFEDPDVETPLTAARLRATLDRRRFLALTGISAGAAVLVGLGARALAAGTEAATAVRETLKLPGAALPADPIPPGTELGIDGLAPYVTPNADFYRIDTALRVPQVDPDTWVLKVSGLVEEPFEITFAELLDLPLEEHVVTLACVSNPVGGDLVGNATWLGYPIRELLARARPAEGADMVLSTSADGWTASTPLEVLADESRDCLLAVGMNGEPLPIEHGFPARLVVPGLYGYVSATKWVTELKVTTFADDVAYWSTRGWSERGPIKISSRIDTPRISTDLVAGPVRVAGMAWHQHTGIAGVEVQVDDGPWQPAQLADAVSTDTWVQWVFDWDATAGNHTLRSRATGEDGEVQTEDRANPAPDGATGWHTMQVSVE
ncbi:molybdopterin-dependent oxidoreductase [Paraoerskovia sediminicola]|uniref:molybdopterin-dependent oxidoreductase n=1 Tax=Paraoerskovia sediminicola TaxID=1138587 RepID=UPI002572EBB0|nr:molybdopterin-dependent oxidoreductase [Paraoerskovia sediminicola]